MACGLWVTDLRNLVAPSRFQCHPSGNHLVTELYFPRATSARSKHTLNFVRSPRESPL